MKDKVEMIRNLTNCTFPEKDILVDLQYTQSAEVTVNRIFEGQFLKNTVLDKRSTNYDDSESDGIEIISVQQSQRSVAIELLSSPLPSTNHQNRANALPCSSSMLTTAISKSKNNSVENIDADLFSEDFEEFESLPGNNSIHPLPKPAFLEDSSDDELRFPCSVPTKLDHRISSSTDEFDMAFMRKRSVDPRFGRPFNLNISLPEPKIIPKLSKKTHKPLANNNHELDVEKQKRARAKQQQKADLALEKRLEKQRKAEEKEKMLLEKEITQAVKSANVLRQKISAAEEIIVSICSEWSQDISSKAICEAITQSGARVIPAKHKLPYTLTFSRKVNRDFDFFESRVWKPCSERIEVEPYTLFYFTAEKLAKLIKEKNGLVNSLNQVMTIYPGHTYIYLIEDLLEYFKKWKRLKAKLENDCLKAAMGEKVTKRKEDVPAILAEMPEPKDFENSLALLHNFGRGRCKIQISPASETAGWVVSFLQQIAIFPEMHVKSSLNVQSADVRSGKDPKDTWIKMLQVIPSVTVRIAEAIARKYPTCNSLISVLLNMEVEAARKILVGIPVEAAVGGIAKKSIGLAQSEKIVKVLLELD